MGRPHANAHETGRPVRPSWAAIGLLLACILIKAFLAHSRVPFWDADPTIEAAPETTLTPFLAFVVDAMVLAAGAWIVVSRRRAEDRFPWISGALLAMGCVGVLLHGLVLTPLIATGGTPQLRGDPASLLLGSAWASAMVGPWSLALAARDAGARRAILATLVGASLILVARGGYQVFVEHPRLVSDFEQHRAEILQARGWETDSATARLFERRLRQAEATGWFGLSNAYGSILAMATVALAVMALGAWRSWRSGRAASGDAGALALAAIVAGIGLCLSGSKGAIGAALLGGASAAAFSLVGQGRARAWIGPVLCAAVFGGLVARGVIGEQIGELSLLFRWHYTLGAVRTIAEHPLLGVGPAAFKDAYLLNKPPLNPEEVESAHSLPLDWLATLGLSGAAWLGVWVFWLANLSRGVEGAPGNAEGESRAAPSWFWLVVFGAPLALSAAREWPALMPDLALLLAVAAIGAWIIARLIANPGVVGESAIRIGASAAAAGLAAHLMIEVSGTLPGSAGWVLAFIGVAAARPSSAEDAPLFEEAARTDRRRVVAAGLMAGGAAAVVWFGVLPAFAWGGLALQRAVAQLEPVREVRRAPLKSSEPAALVVEAERTAFPRALAELGMADSIWPVRSEALDAASRLNMRLAVDANSVPGAPAEEARDAARRAVALAEQLANRLPASSGAWARLGRALRASAELTGDKGMLADAREAWKRSATLDPYSLTPAVEVCDLAIALDDRKTAHEWASKALVIDLQLRLDPIKRLTDAERWQLHAIGAFEDPRIEFPWTPKPELQR